MFVLLKAGNCDHDPYLPHTHESVDFLLLVGGRLSSCDAKQHGIEFRKWHRPAFPNSQVPRPEFFDCRIVFQTLSDTVKTVRD
jgi:hypothetical protein